MHTNNTNFNHIDNYVYYFHNNDNRYIEGVNLNQDFIDTITDLPNINEM